MRVMVMVMSIVKHVSYLGHMGALSQRSSSFW